jgi:hypothetical protein
MPISSQNQPLTLAAMRGFLLPQQKAAPFEAVFVSLDDLFALLVSKAQRDLATFFVDVENAEFLALIESEDLLWVNIVTFAKLRNMNQGFDSWRNLNECTKWGDTSNRTFNLVTLLELCDFG